MKDDESYTGTLDTDEIRQICKAIWDQYIETTQGRDNSDDLLAASPEELSEEYAFWCGELEERHEQTLNSYSGS